MNPEAQLVLIAEACPGLATLNEEGDWVWKRWPVKKFFNPLTDLNAMHMAAMTLCEEDQVEFCLRLTEVVRRGKPVGTGVRQWDETNATAAERAEAFLRTIKKWVEPRVELPH